MQVIIEFFQLLMSGVQQVMSFLTTLPQILSTCVIAFPPVLSTYLLAGLAVIICIRVLELLP